MGLTIHYGLSSKTRSRRAKALVERMRQLALDLPFETVDDQVRHLGPTCASGPSTTCGPTRTCSLPCWTAASM